MSRVRRATMTPDDATIQEKHAALRELVQRHNADMAFVIAKNAVGNVTAVSVYARGVEATALAAWVEARESDDK